MTPVLRGALAVLLVSALQGCSDDADADVGGLPVEFHGTWYFLESSGGFTGEGDPAAAKNAGHMVLGAATIQHYDAEGVHVGTATFEARLGRSIFAAEPQWMLAMDGNVLPAETVVMLSDDGQTLSVATNVYDGYGTTYSRTFREAESEPET